MFLIIVIAVIAVILIIPAGNKNQKSKEHDSFSYSRDETIKPKTGFLTMAGNFIRKMLKGK